MIPHSGYGFRPSTTLALPMIAIMYVLMNIDLSKFMVMFFPESD